jgi:hypothetical protein
VPIALTQPGDRFEGVLERLLLLARTPHTLPTCRYAPRRSGLNDGGLDRSASQLLDGRRDRRPQAQLRLLNNQSH